MSQKGKFYVFDGPEGSGKSTILRRLKAEFGDKIVTTREPGGSPYGEDIRKVILGSPNAKTASAKTLATLFWAARCDHVEKLIAPAVENGEKVATDRFDSATFALEIYGYEAEELRKDFFHFRNFFIGDCKPDLYIFFDVDVQVALARKNSGKQDLNHLDEKPIEFHERVREGFREFMKLVPSVTIDASRTEDEVYEEVVSILGLR
jgi:dTMP kinase